MNENACGCGGETAERKPLLFCDIEKDELTEVASVGDVGAGHIERERRGEGRDVGGENNDDA